MVQNFPSCVMEFAVRDTVSMNDIVERNGCRCEPSLDHIRMPVGINVMPCL